MLYVSTSLPSSRNVSETFLFQPASTVPPAPLAPLECPEDPELTENQESPVQSEDKEKSEECPDLRTLPRRAADSALQDLPATPDTLARWDHPEEW